ncbi:AraC family transcriptional regulator [Pedobacter sp. R-06]|uniref:AraC family transcriptional regulator n=1 Tax=Pedobacter sp. R-06 TaxID=3404051 RepID=UPI003CF6AD72
MRYRQILPSASLRDFIRYYWILEHDCTGYSPNVFKIFSDGCPGLIFQITGNPSVDKKNDKLPDLFIYGQTTKHSQHTSWGKFRTIGIYFYPNGLQSIFGIDANDLTDTSIDLCLLDQGADMLVDRLFHADSDYNRIEILSSYLFEKILTRKVKRRFQFLDPILAIQRNSMRKTIKEIQDELHISERSLERLFNQSIGIPPKLFLRIMRFQSALTELRGEQSRSLSEIALMHNYSDHSHFIREFKEFSGLQPKQFNTRTKEIVENFPLLRD